MVVNVVLGGDLVQVERVACRITLEILQCDTGDDTFEMRATTRVENDMI